MTLEPEDVGQVATRGDPQARLEYLRLLAEVEAVEIRRQTQHFAMLLVQRDVTLVAVLTNQAVQGIAVGHPADEARVGRQWNDGEALNPTLNGSLSDV